MVLTTFTWQDHQYLLQGSHNNPTLPIVQIALRLANHLV